MAGRNLTRQERQRVADLASTQHDIPFSDVVKSFPDASVRDLEDAWNEAKGIRKEGVIGRTIRSYFEKKDEQISYAAKNADKWIAEAEQQAKIARERMEAEHQAKIDEIQDRRVQDAIDSVLNTPFSPETYDGQYKGSMSKKSIRVEIPEGVIEYREVINEENRRDLLCFMNNSTKNNLLRNLRNSETAITTVEELNDADMRACDLAGISVEF